MIAMCICIKKAQSGLRFAPAMGYLGAVRSTRLQEPGEEPRTLARPDNGTAF